MKSTIYKGYSIRYHNFGRGWFAHIRRPGSALVMDDGVILPIDGESVDAMLARARRRIDDEERAPDEA